MESVDWYIECLKVQKERDALRARLEAIEKQPTRAYLIFWIERDVWTLNADSSRAEGGRPIKELIERPERP